MTRCTRLVGRETQCSRSQSSSHPRTSSVLSSLTGKMSDAVKSDWEIVIVDEMVCFRTVEGPGSGVFGEIWKKLHGRSMSC